MLRILTIIIFISVLVNVEAQESVDLQWPNQLYFYYFSSGVENQIYYIQENSKPTLTFSMQPTVLGFSWSHNGSKLAIVRGEREGKLLAEIYNDNFHLLQQFEVDIYNNDLFHFPMAWSSDDEFLFLISTSGDGLAKITRLTLSSSTEIITVNIPLLETEQLSQVYWSPNAKYLLYQTVTPLNRTLDTSELNIPQPEMYKLYLFDLGSSKTIRVTSSSFRNCIAWSQQGDFFAIISDYIRELAPPVFLRARQLQIYDLDVNLVSTIDFGYQPENAFSCPLAWSNDGKRIALSYSTVSKSNSSDSNLESITLKTGIAAIDITTGDHHIVGISDVDSYQVVSIEWSPDDAWIAINALYNAFRDVRVFSFDTGKEIVITVDDLPLFDPTWRILMNS